MMMSSAISPTIRASKRSSKRALSRRGFLGGGLATAATVALGGVSALLKAVPASAQKHRGPLLGFQSVAVSTADTVVVPPGYTAKVLIAWGDPVSNGPAFKPDASNSAADQALQWGMHNDGVVYFPINGSSRGLLVQNNEYTDDGLLFPDGIANWSAEKTNKSSQRPWRVDRRNHQAARQRTTTAAASGRSCVRRSTRAASPARRRSRSAVRLLAMTGLKTSADPTGKLVLGTLNNCAMGFTPWGTYLACEENFNGYFFRTTTADGSTLRAGKALRHLPLRFRLPAAHHDPRFNADTEPNEPNRFGWVVEIDPFNPQSTPVKRTALGRFKHEGAWVQESKRRQDRRLHGRRRAQRIYLPICLEPAVAGGAPTRESIRSTTAFSTSPNSTPMARVNGCR